MIKFAFYISLFTLCSFVPDGGGRYSSGITISDYDRNLNLFYSDIEGNIPSNKKRKGDTDSTITTNNVAIYDLGTLQTTYLFPINFDQEIVDFNFEKYYSKEESRIIYTNESDYNDNRVKNNFNVKERSTSDYLIIVTYSLVNSKYTLWMAHKTGKDLKSLYTSYSDIDYHVDASNKKLRIRTSKYKRLEVTSFDL